MSKLILILSLLLIVSSTTAEEEKKLSRKECEDLGFTGLALCSDCNALSEYLKDQELLSDCRKCCDEDSDDATSKAEAVSRIQVNLQRKRISFQHSKKIIYAGAVLEVCMRKLVFYPEVVNFIEDEKEKFPSVKVQYSFNAPPKLIMLDDAGQHKEIIRIDNWKREHIIEFLREKLKPTSAV